MKKSLFRLTTLPLIVSLLLTTETTPSWALRPNQEGPQRAGMEEILQSGPEQKNKVYVNAEIKNGRLVGSPKPIHEGIRVGPTLWTKTKVLQARTLFLEGIHVHRMGKEGKEAGFSLKSKQYQVDGTPGSITRLLVEADPRDGRAQAAYDLETGRKVYPRETRIQVYLNDEKSPWFQANVIPKGLWNRKEVLDSRKVVIEGVKTFANSKSSRSRAGFAIDRNRRYSTTRKFDPNHPLKLRVVVDPWTGIVQAAYDLATGEQVYDPEDLMSFYLDPEISEGRLVSPADPFLVAAALSDSIWTNRIRTKTSGPFAIRGVDTSDKKGFSGFSLLGETYYTTRKFDPKKPLRLLVVMDPETRLPSVAYDVENGEKVFDSEDLTAVYFDPEVREGRLVNPGAPYRRMGIVRTSVWEEARERGVQGVALFGVKTFETRGPKTSKSMYAFSVAANVYRTDRLFDPKKPLRLLVLIDSENQNPTQAFDAETGEKVYDIEEMIRVYLDPTVEKGRVAQPSKPAFSARMIRDEAWDRIRQGTVGRVAFDGISGYHQKNRAYFLLAGKQYRTSHPLKPGQPSVRLLVVADAATKTPVEAFLAGTGEQVFPVGSSPTPGDARLERLADLAQEDSETPARGADPRLSRLANLALPDDADTQAGAEEQAVQWVESTHPLFTKGGYLTPEPVKEENVGEDGVTVPIIKPGMKPMKLVLPDKYRQKGRRPIEALSADHVAAQIHLTADGRLTDRPVIKLVFDHAGQTATEYFLARKRASGAPEVEFISVIPGLTPVQHIALSKEWWLDKYKVRPVGEFTLTTSRSGYWLDLGRGSYPDGTRAALRIWLPKDRFQGKDPFPVTVRTEWQEKAYLRPAGTRVAGYVTVVTVDKGSEQEQEFRYRFTGQNGGFSPLGAETELLEVQNAGAALQGDPGDFLDYLLIYFGDDKTEAEVKEMVRRFDELRLGQVAVGGPGGKGRGKILLEDYFEKAAIFAKKPLRDQETLIAVLLKVAFRELVKTEMRQELFRMLDAKIGQLREQAEQNPELLKQVDFFMRLQSQIHILTDKALLFQPDHIKTKLLPHQAVGGYFFSTTPRGYNGDYTGAGKSIETLAALNPEWKTFIAAPATLVDNWIKEIHKHVDPRYLKSKSNPDGIEIVVLSGSRERRERILKETRDRKKIIIIASIQGFQGKEELKWTREKLADLNHGLDCFVLDESQFAANYRGEGLKSNAQQAEAMQMITAPNIWWLSATGYGSDPSQLWATLAVMTRGTPEEDRFREFKKFRKQFPAKQASGLRHLRGEMRPRSLSREAPEVMDHYDDPANGVPLEKQGARLPNLTERSYKDLGSFTLNDEQEKALLMMIQDFPAFTEWFNQRVIERGEPERQLDPQDLNPFVMLSMILRLAVDPQYCGCDQESPVWEELDKIIEQFVVREHKKGILYTENTVILEKLLERYGRYGVARIDGSVRGHVEDPNRPGEILMGYFDEGGELVIDHTHPEAVPVEAKTYARHLFQNDPNIRLVIANMKAGGIGLDLTAAEFEWDVQLPRVYTLDRQMKGRFDRMDMKRPRYRIERGRMVSMFKPGLAERWKGTEYQELTQELEKSGTPDEINIERLEMGKQVFKYVMTDLATDRDLDLFDPHGLWEAIPGIKDNPTVEQYYSTLPSKRLKETLEMFLPMYEKARGRERKQQVVHLAELYFRTGMVHEMESLVALLADESDDVIRMVSSLRNIPNKYARTLWLNHIIQLVTRDLPAREIRLGDLVETFEFLEDQAAYLILPVYDTAKAYDNGPTLDILTGLLSEIQDAYRQQPREREFLFQQMALWFLAARGPKVGEDFRDALRQVLGLYERVMLSKQLSLKDRLEVVEKLLRLVQFPAAVNELLEDGAPKDLEGARKALEKATVAAAQSEFKMSGEAAGRFVQAVSGALTVLQIHRLLVEKYPDLADGLREGMEHAAAGDFGPWRNLQQGDRWHGKKVDYLADQPGFWEVFTREETVSFPGPMILGFERHQAQLVKTVGSLMEMMAQGDSQLVGEIDGEWVGNQFREWSQKAKGFGRSAGPRRKSLASALVKLRKDTQFKDLEPVEKKALEAEGFGTPDKWNGLADKVKERLLNYGHLQAWLDFKKSLDKLLEEKPAPQQIAEIKALASRLSGRAAQAGVIHVADRLDLFVKFMEGLKSKESYTGLAVQFTTDVAWMMERGMLHPKLADCFNSFGNPDQTSALMDDLNSRNKILGLVWPADVVPSWENRDKVLARVIVKVKKREAGENGLPALFPERPLSVGAYDFEEEILQALRTSKMPELEKYGAELWREGTPGEERQFLYETGGYSEWEYFETLFKILRRTNRTTPIFHQGVKAAGAEEKIQIYADPVIEKGRLVGNPTPLRSYINVPRSVWQLPEIRQAKVVALANLVPFAQGGSRKVFGISINQKRYYTGLRYEEGVTPPKVLLLVDPQTRALVEMYNQETGALLVSAANEIKIYLDPVLEAGKLPPDLALFATAARSVQAPFWELAEVKKASRVVLANVLTHKQGVYAAFPAAGTRYRTQRRYDLEKPFRVVVVLDGKTKVPVEAYDQATGELVYTRSDAIDVYFTPLRDGRLPKSARPAFTAKVFKTSFWDLETVRGAPHVVLGNVPTHDDKKGAAQFGLGKTYRTSKPFDERNPLKLIVVMDKVSRTPLEAFDQATGEKVYPIEGWMEVYLDPVLQAGKLAGDPKPFRRTGILHPSFWKLEAVRQSEEVVLGNVATFNLRGTAAFAAGGRNYYTPLRFDPGSPLQLLVRMDPKEIVPIAAYDMASGKQVFSSADLQNVYLDAEVKDGRLVGEPKVFWMAEHLGRRFWSRPELAKAKQVAVTNVRINSYKDHVAFSFGGEQYSIPLSPDNAKMRALLVVADPVSKVPLSGYDMATGTQVYPPYFLRHFYVNVLIEGGRLSGDPKPVLSISRIGSSVWSNKVFEGASSIVVSNVPTYSSGYGPAVFSFDGESFPTGRRFQEKQPFKLLVSVDVSSKRPVAAYAMDTGQQVYPAAAQSADERLAALVNLGEGEEDILPSAPGADARLGDLTRLAGDDQAGMEEALSGLLERWAAVEGTDSVVVSDQLVGGPEGKLIRLALERMPERMARRVYAAGNWKGLSNRWLKVIPSGAPEDVAFEVSRQVPAPEKAWVIGSLGRVFGVLLKDFSIEVEELMPGEGLEEFLAQLGLALGVPLPEIEEGLERIRNADIYGTEA